MTDMTNNPQTASSAVPAAVPPTDQAALRERIAAALYEAEFPGFDWRQAHSIDWEQALERASAVLAVLPPAADRAAVLASVRPQTLTAIASHIDARSVAILRPESETYTEWQAVADALRRVADEAQQQGAAQPQPLCRCGHPESDHQGPQGLGGAQCRVCPGDSERVWRHAFTPVAGAQQPEGAAPEEALDLADGPVHCPLCPNTVTLHTPNGARAHFTTVHPEQQLVGPGPWPLLATDGGEARQQPDTETGAVSRQTLVGLIRDFRDPDPCQLDHHGYCQAHVWMCSGSPCPHARAREVLAAIDAEEAAVSGPGGVADENPAETHEAQQQCPGYETVPNRCTCDCEGCKHHCGAHDPQPAVGPRVAAEAPHTATPDELCGRTKSNSGTEYPPCARPAGHEEAYCRGADGRTHFLALYGPRPAPAVVAQPEETETPRAIVHGCPPDGSGLTPCCGRTPFELPLTDRISSEAPITCPGAVVSQPGKET